jgi:hypothetical protein
MKIDTCKLTRSLSPQQSSRLTEILKVESFPLDRIYVIGSDRVNFAWSPVSESIVLYGVNAGKGNLATTPASDDTFRQTECLILHALTGRSFVKSLLEEYSFLGGSLILRSLLAFTLGGVPNVLAAFGISNVNEMLLAQLAVGDFLTAQIRMLLRPVFMWWSRKMHYDRDALFIRTRGYKKELVRVLMQRVEVARLEYEMSPLYEFLNSGVPSIKSRLVHIESIAEFVPVDPNTKKGP